MRLKTVLAVGGSDPTAGAGIQADVRTLEAFGVQSATVVTAVTVQTPSRVLRVQPLSPQLIGEQLRAVLDSMDIAVVKIGMMATAASVSVVARLLDEYDVGIVVDPVLRPTRGRALAGAGVCECIVEELLPQATCVTPNLAEARALTGSSVTDLAGMQRAARALVDLGAAAAVVKGGHLSARADDVVWDGLRMRVLRGERVRRRKRAEPGALHGSGCAFASAVAALLASSYSPARAAAGAKRYVRSLLETGVAAGDGAILRIPGRFSAR